MGHKAFYILYILIMNSTYNITEAQAKLPGLVREAEGMPIVITRHDRPVAYIISKKRMDAIAETLEILADPDAMKAIRSARDGHTVFTSLHELDSD